MHTVLFVETFIENVEARFEFLDRIPYLVKMELTLANHRFSTCQWQKNCKSKAFEIINVNIESILDLQRSRSAGQISEAIRASIGRTLLHKACCMDCLSKISAQLNFDAQLPKRHHR